MILMTLGELRQMESLTERVREKAEPEIKREAVAWSFFDALDQIPKGWPEDLGECEDFCEPCLNKALKRKGIKKLLGKDWDGPHRDCYNEGERSRDCYHCGCPLPWALLEYGMEELAEWYESDLFYDRLAGKPNVGTVDANDWYWLWRLCQECLGCESYLNTYGQRVRLVLCKALPGREGVERGKVEWYCFEERP